MEFGQFESDHHPEEVVHRARTHTRQDHSRYAPERAPAEMPWSRREEDHQRWEDIAPFGSIRAKGRLAVRLSALMAGRRQRKAGHRNQRNNRREY